MDSEKVLKEVREKYPGKNVVCFPNDESPTEIIVELEPSTEHPERSLALAIVGKSEPHYHKVSTEVYEVTKGTLLLTIEGKTHTLKEGEKMTIKPNQVHNAEGKGETWFLTHSKPGWKFEDHIIV